jgi:hypothetical protein
MSKQCLIGRSSHKFSKPTCDSVSSCCKKQSAFEARDFIDTRVNIIKNKVRSSCCFSTFELGAFYDDMSDPDAAFVTHSSHPSAVTIPPAELSKGAVFLIKSFVTTNIHTGNQSVHVNEDNEFEVSISHPGLLPDLPNVITDDTPREAHGGNFIFGSFDLLLEEIFKKYNGQPTSNSHLNNSGTGFISLTNPNELEFGTTNIVQIIWPDNLEWEFSFVANNNKLYTYSSNSCLGDCGSVTESDLADPSVTTTLGSGQCTGSWAVPCNPLGYMTQRQTFDYSFPGISGCSGVTDGIMCVEEIKIEKHIVRIPKSCLCAPFEDDAGRTGIAGPSGNHIILTDLLNKAFESKSLKGWKAIPDIEYGYFRILHPDNVLFFSIKMSKMFQKDGVFLPQCSEMQIYRQGALTEFIKPDNDMNQITTTNNMCIMDGLCWSTETDMNGCFLIE